jgi:ceramide glucosyltransferase
VTLLKPLCGLEPNIEQNLASFFDQDYPNFEIIFGTRDDKDPVLAVVRAIQQRFPQVPVKFAFSGEPDRPNAKVCSLVKMYQQAAYDLLVISDSDVHVTRGYIREVTRPLLGPDVGMVSCIYRGVPTGGLWSRLEALGMSVEMTSGVMVAELLEGMTFALGPTMAIRRDALEAVGGMGPLVEYCADDYVLGNEVHLSGRKVVLSKYVVDHVVLGRAFKASMLHQLRWMKSTRFSRPSGHLGTVLTFAMPFGILGAVVGAAAGKPVLAASLLAWALVNRIVMSIAAGYGVVGDWRSLRDCWLYPVRDLMGFFFWCGSYFGDTIDWRGERYRLLAKGKMVKVGGEITSEESASVAVDNLS